MAEPDNALEALSAREEEHAALSGDVNRYLENGLPSDAYQVADMAWKRYHQDGDKTGEARAQLLRAVVLATMVDLDSEVLLENARAAVDAFKALGDSQGTMEAMQVHFDVLRRLQQYSAAAQAAKDVVMHCSQGGDRAELAAANLMLAEASLAGGDKETALQAARQAANHYDQTGTISEKALCALTLAKVYNASQDADTAVEEAKRARGLFKQAKDKGGQAGAALAESVAHKQSGEFVEALRAAEAACQLAFVGQCPDIETDAVVAVAEAQTNILEERGGATYASIGPILHSAEFALAIVKARKPKEQAAVALAQLTHGRMLLMSKALKGAFLAAKAATRGFRKLGDNHGRARALLVWCAADLELGYLQEARATAEAAFSIFDQVGDTAGKQKAFDLSESITRAMGLPTQAELQEQQRMMQLRQQEMMMMQAMQAQGFQGGQLMTTPTGGDMPEQLTTAAQQERKAREGAALDLKAGLDLEVIRKKVLEVAQHTIGDDEAIEADLPLMEAGLTSNTAILLRDELTKDLPGVYLPPTLIFDYPSIGSIADYVVEQTAKKG